MQYLLPVAAAGAVRTAEAGVVAVKAGALIAVSAAIVVLQPGPGGVDSSSSKRTNSPELSAVIRPDLIFLSKVEMKNNPCSFSILLKVETLYDDINIK